MKIKHILTIYVFLIGSLLMWAFSGCGYNQRGVCVRNALYYGEYWKAKGYEIRYGHKETSPRHMWAEYKVKGKWVRAIDTVEYRPEADWYGYEQ